MADPLIGDYRFGGLERRAYDALRGGPDEKWAYLVFARGKHAAEDQRIAGHPRRRHKWRNNPFLVMKEWRALDERSRHERIRAARRDPNRPDAVAVEVEVVEEPDSPGSIEDWSDVNETWAQELEYRFVKTVYQRYYREESAPDNGFWSVVRLYSGVDDTGRVRDRVVVKVADWEVPLIEPDPNDRSAFRIYREVDMMKRKYRRVDRLPKCDHILKPRYWTDSAYEYRPTDENGNVRTTPDGAEVTRERLGIRSYTDYCEFGDLSDVLFEYSWENDKLQDTDSMKIPEAFIWHVFHAISIALYVLYTKKEHMDGKEEVEGKKNINGSNKGDVDGWMIHRDIKPHVSCSMDMPSHLSVSKHINAVTKNIFLMAPANPDDYPRPVLADFDCATMTNFGNYRGGGTNGYIAPIFFLQEHFEDDGYPDVDPITTKTDIWSLAGVIWDLMNSKRGFFSTRDKVGLKWLRRKLHEAIANDDPHLDDEYPTHDYMQKHLDPRDDLPAYTSWLEDLVKDCSR
ncbi:uncharacterized protein N0V89_008001 [Didymosphaeria variabile]|uniref:non-specific serine/threonine protein kinase n=1 Tax=Didymosphaeria variabile TaxID=1932322 RepID=A0A9W9C835_9PLEO|nr:uncharacterized protein N0V89_008001 [Didymosphaeria variabile]KAJ4349386.1 hypothetical protein N0V89_008001 [Didymosphaeria variabile]